MPLLMFEVDVQDEYTDGEMQATAKFDTDNMRGSVLQWLQNEHDQCGLDADLYVHQATQNGTDWQLVILDRCQDGGSMIVTCKLK